jgi:hypothetical protein
VIVLLVLWRRRSWAATAACAFLIGSTGLGWFLASYLVAPLITGGSHDTAPWSETVVAASTAAAGIAMILAAATRLAGGRVGAAYAPIPG